MREITAPPHRVRNLIVRRWIARLIDWVLVLAASSFLWIVSIYVLRKQLVESGYQLPIMAAVGLFNRGWAGAATEVEAATAGLLQTIVAVVAATLLAQLLAAAVYDWAGHRFLGRTLGKALAGLRVRTCDVRDGSGGGERLGNRAALIRTGWVVVVPGLGWVLLIMAFVSWNPVLVLVGLGLLFVSVLESVALRRGPVGQVCAHDRWSRSVVLPVSLRDHVVALDAGTRGRDRRELVPRKPTDGSRPRRLYVGWPATVRRRCSVRGRHP